MIFIFILQCYSWISHRQGKWPSSNLLLRSGAVEAPCFQLRWNELRGCITLVHLKYGVGGVWGNFTCFTGEVVEWSCPKHTLNITTVLYHIQIMLIIYPVLVHRLHQVWSVFWISVEFSWSKIARWICVLDTCLIVISASLEIPYKSWSTKPMISSSSNLFSGSWLYDQWTSYNHQRIKIWFPYFFSSRWNTIYPACY